jgi:hypothetical protein
MAAIMDVPSTDLDKTKIIVFEAATRPSDASTMGRRTPDYFL